MDLSKKPFGCDGEGRILGGLGAVPGFGWWPIKAYRPCPSLDQAGVEYTRWVWGRTGQPRIRIGGGGLAFGALRTEEGGAGGPLSRPRSTPCHPSGLSQPRACGVQLRMRSAGLKPRRRPRENARSKGQATNEVLFGGVSLGDAQQQSLERMKQTQERGLDVDI